MTTTVCSADRKMRVLGSLFVLLGLLANKWAIESVLAPDVQIDSIANVIVLILLQLWVITGGAWLFVKGRDKSGPTTYAAVLIGLSIAILVAGYANLLALNVMG